MTFIVSVEGIPAPQGSKQVFRGRPVESSKRVKPWRAAVRTAAAIQADQDGLLRPLNAPYRIGMWFYIPKPRTTRAQHPVAPAIGDLDKLTRSTLDALTEAGVILDDRFVTELIASKQWAGVGEKPGAIIRITEHTNGSHR